MYIVYDYFTIFTQDKVNDYWCICQMQMQIQILIRTDDFNLLLPVIKNNGDDNSYTVRWTITISKGTNDFIRKELAPIKFKNYSLKMVHFNSWFE